MCIVCLDSKEWLSLTIIDKITTTVYKNQLEVLLHISGKQTCSRKIPDLLSLFLFVMERPHLCVFRKEASSLIRKIPQPSGQTCPLASLKCFRHPFRFQERCNRSWAGRSVNIPTKTTVPAAGSQKHCNSKTLVLRSQPAIKTVTTGRRKTCHTVLPCSF